MSPLGWLRGLGRVVNTVIPREPSGAELLRAMATEPSPTALSVAAALAGIDIRLHELTDIPRPLRTEEQADEIDRLLARRQRLTHPAVPVIPGRTP